MINKMQNSQYLIFLILAILTLGACSNDTQKEELNKEEALRHYAALVLHNYEAAHKDAIQLQKVIQSFTNDPSEKGFEIAKRAWLQSRETYVLTEAFRFQDGPIEIIGDKIGPEAHLNAWPLDEGYIDYVKGNDKSGIINDKSIAIEKAILRKANEKEGEENISTGYHAIEFLLWGQDLSAPAEKQAGQRPFTDFLDKGTAKNQDRRRLYLNLCADMIVEDLAMLIDEWKTDGAYRKAFLAMPADAALAKIMTGIATLAKAELAGERMFVAYDNRDQEDEHSCFSDNTHRDTRLDLQGIHNVYFASYNGKDHYSIHKMVEQTNPRIAASIKSAFDAAEKAVEATAIPFDFAISDNTERKKVLVAVKALRNLGNKIVEAGSVLNIEVGASRLN